LGKVKLTLLLVPAFCGAALAGEAGYRAALHASAGQTTHLARKLALARIETIAGASGCRESFGQQRIDLDRLRLAARQSRFYSALGPEAGLRFSDVIGKPASPGIPRPGCWTPRK